VLGGERANLAACVHFAQAIQWHGQIAIAQHAAVIKGPTALIHLEHLRRDISWEFAE
jgi:hypothetical protein